jgi:hypothetical protein
MSIDVKNFDSVCCLALGVTTVSAVCQTRERVRDDVPRHLFAKKLMKKGRCVVFKASLILQNRR